MNINAKMDERKAECNECNERNECNDNERQEDDFFEKQVQSIDEWLEVAEDKIKKFYHYILEQQDYLNELDHNYQTMERCIAGRICSAWFRMLYSTIYRDHLQPEVEFLTLDANVKMKLIIPEHSYNSDRTMITFIYANIHDDFMDNNQQKRYIECVRLFGHCLYCARIMKTYPDHPFGICRIGGITIISQTASQTATPMMWVAHRFKNSALLDMNIFKLISSMIPTLTHPTMVNLNDLNFNL